jgi:uncharacterized protein YlaI
MEDNYNKWFNTRKIRLTQNEKLKRYNDFVKYEGFASCKKEEFLAKDVYEEFLDVKCLNCDFNNELDYDEVSYEWLETKDSYPIFYCNECHQPKLVPIDVYNRLKK